MTCLLSLRSNMLALQKARQVSNGSVEEIEAAEFGQALDK
jgi:hypothetical protein